MKTRVLDLLDELSTPTTTFPLKLPTIGRKFWPNYSNADAILGSYTGNRL